ncbi:hypothetical protein AAG570_011534 [Ranatra chinensis]|uniref:Organic solute transporter alpha-like protein n=1 Tax=Ranatra chinensis TaxID=642074 RepID=A0ABD0Z340_9HEMI
MYLYVDTLRHLLATSCSTTKTHSLFVISIYPVVAVATFCAIIVPRAQMVAEAAIQVTVMSCLYQLFCLFVAYSGGESELIQKAMPNTLNLRVGPCCCWPCCICLPSIELTKIRVLLLRLLVLQLPIVQGFSYMVMLIMWSEQQTIYQVNNGYLQPLVVTSILFGVWGLIMTLKVTSGFLKDYHLQGKFIVLQLVLVLTKIQGLFARMGIWAKIFPCKYPMTPALYSHMIYNIVILLEMVLLGWIARNLYKQNIPEIRSSKHPQYITQKLGTEEEKSKPDSANDNNNTSVVVKSDSRDHII